MGAARHGVFIHSQLWRENTTHAVKGRIIGLGSYGNKESIQHFHFIQQRPGDQQPDVRHIVLHSFLKDSILIKGVTGKGRSTWVCFFLSHLLSFFPIICGPK